MAFNDTKSTGDSVTADEWNTMVDNLSVKNASYIIFKDGSTVKALNGSTGSIDYSSTNASAVIQYAINHLTSGRTWMETIVLKGDFTVSSIITVYDNTVINIDGKMEASGSIDIFNINGSNITIKGGILDVNSGKCAIKSIGDTNKILIEDVSILEYGERGIYFVDSYDNGEIVLNKIYVRYSNTTPIHKDGAWGIYIGNAESIRLINSVFENIPNDACEIHGNNIVIDNNYINTTSDGGVHAIPLASNSSIIVTNNYIVNCNNNKGIGIGTDDGSITTYGAIVTNNYIRNIDGTKSAIRLQYTRDSIVSDNI